MLGIDEHPKADRPLIEVRTYRARPGQLQQRLMPLLEDYASVLVVDDEHLWERWPSEAR